MGVIEKIFEDIDKTMECGLVDYINGDPVITKKKAKDIICKHMNDGWIPAEDERLWDILFEEACVEGEQQRRIYNRLKETFGGERSEMNGKL